jgi:hypothetical protein
LRPARPKSGVDSRGLAGEVGHAAHRGPALEVETSWCDSRQAKRSVRSSGARAGAGAPAGAGSASSPGRLAAPRPSKLPSCWSSARGDSRPPSSRTHPRSAEQWILNRPRRVRRAMGQEAGWCASLSVGDRLSRGRPDQVKPTFRTKCPSFRLSTPPPARCTMYASKMMPRITTTSQKKNTMMPGMAYPDIVLALAMATRYPPPPELMRRGSGCARDDVGPPRPVARRR